MNFVKDKLIVAETAFRSFKEKRSNVSGFLDDYAYLLQAGIKLYQVTFDEEWIRWSEKLLNYTIDHFYSKADGYFNYTDKDAEKLIADKKEIFDNVIPSSNSVMAQNLVLMSTLLDNTSWREIAKTMTLSLSELITSEPNYMSNWAIALMMLKKDMAEVVIMGDDANALAKEWHSHYKPFVVVMGHKTAGQLPLLQGKTALENKTTIYVCYQNTCKQPVHAVAEAMKLL